MKKTAMKKIVLLIIFIFSFTSAAFSMTCKAVGMQTLRVVNEGQKHCLVSIPFFKPASIQGKLDGVDTESMSVTNSEGLFGKLDKSYNYFLLIRSGNKIGAWFSIKNPEKRAAFSDNPAKVFLDVEKASESSLDGLTGNELFSVHPMYRITELFPEDGSVLPAGKFDFNSGQLHFNTGKAWKKYWLSNGELTSAKGWMNSEWGTPIKLDNLALLPGISFVAFHPNPEKNIDIQIVGEVLDIPLRKPVKPGYNFVTLEYNLSRTNEAGYFSLKINDSGLSQSGFHAGQNIDKSDSLTLWNFNLADYDSPLWLSNYNSMLEWMTSGNASANDEALAPGTGMIINNKGAAYVWIDGEI